MVDWYALFVSSFQSTTSKTIITQQRCLCSTYQDAGEIHTSTHLKVGSLEHIEKVKPGEYQRWCLWSWTSGQMAELTASENLVASEEVAQTPTSWLQCHLQLQGTEQQHRDLWPCSLQLRRCPATLPSLPTVMTHTNLTTPNLAEAPEALGPPIFPPHLMAPGGDALKALAAGTMGNTSVRGRCKVKKCILSNTTRGNSGKRNPKLVLFVMLTTKI